MPLFQSGQAVRVAAIDPQSKLAQEWAKICPENYQAAHAGIDEPLAVYECNGPGRFAGECSVLVFPRATFAESITPGQPGLTVHKGDQVFRAFVPESVLQADERNLKL
jgi:hypothetical protein